MRMHRKTITLTEQQDDWVKGQIESGHFGNDSEYIRDLIRRDQPWAISACVGKLRPLRRSVVPSMSSTRSSRNPPSSASAMAFATASCSLMIVST